jgi:hypothetical protein
MERDIATGRINIDLNDAEAIAGLRKVDAEFDRLMRNVEHSKASAEIDANIKPLEEQLKKAQLELKELNGKRAEAEIAVKGSGAKFAKDIDQAKLKVEELDGKLATVRIKTAGAAKSIAEMKAVEAAQEHLVRAVEDAEKRTQKVVNQSARVRTALHKQQMGEMRAAESEAHRINASLERERDAAVRSEQARVNKMAAFSKAMETQRARELSASERMAHQMQAERDEIPKLEKAYASLSKEVERLEKAQIKAGKGKDKRLVFNIDIDRRIAMQELDKLRNELRERLGHDPIEIPLQFPRATRFGDRVRREMDQFQRPFLMSAAGIGYRAGGDMADALARGLRAKMSRGLKGNAIDLGSFVKGGGRNIGAGVLGKLGDFGSKLADMSVRLGPFTASIRGAVIALSVLGPIIYDVVGALGALGAVVGSSVVGAMGVGTAAVGAFGLVLGSTALLLPQMLGGYKKLGTLQKAFHDAVDQNGAGSKEAATALEKYNNALQAASPSARSAFKGINELKTGLKSLSKDSQKDFDNALNQGVTTGKSLLKTFGPEMTQSFKLVSDGAATLFKALRSDEAKKDIQQLFDAGQASLPSFGRGLANIGRSIANVAVAFSKALPSLGGGFEKWTDGILKVTQNGPKMAGIVRETVASLRSMGHFLQATGSLLTAFFGGGQKAGRGFLDTMTQAERRWTAFLRTTEGQQKLGDFFQGGVEGVQALYGALAPVIASFVQWSAAIAPVTRGIFLVVGAVSKLVASVLSLTALQSPLTALGATLGVLWGLGKIRAATGAVTAFGAALRGVAVQQEAVAASGAAARAGGALGAFGSRNVAKTPMPVPVGAVGAIEKAAPALTRMGRAGQVAKGGLSGLGAIVTGIASPMAGLGVLAVGAAAGMYLYETRTRSWEKANQSADKSRRAMYAGLEQLPGLTSQAEQAQLGLEQSQLGVVSAGKSLRDINKQITAEQKKQQPSTQALNQLYGQRKQASLDLRQAQISESIATQQNTAAQRELTVAAKQTFAASLANLSSRRKGLEERGGEKLSGVMHVLSAQDREGLNGAKTYKEAYDNIAKAAKAAGVSTRDFINASEALKGDEKLQQYAKQQDQVTNAVKAARNAYNNLALSQANQARIAQGQVAMNEKAAASYGKLTRLGGKTLTTKIATQYDDPSKAAAAGRAAANALQRGAGKSTISAIIKANPNDALAAIRALNATKISPKTVDIITEGGPKALSTLKTLVSARIAPRVMQILAEDGDAKSKIRKLIATGVPPKVARILGDASAAFREAARVNGQTMKTLTQQINRHFDMSSGPAPPPVTQQVLRVYGGVKGHPAGASGGMFASGGSSFSANGISGATEPNARQQNRAAQTALLSGSPNKAVSQKITRPQFLVGEEARPEFVIATNPAYRDRNLRYLAMAAAALGTSIEGFAGGGLPGTFDGAAYNPSNVLGRKGAAQKTSKKPPKSASKLDKARYKKSHAYNQRRPWTDRVEFLADQKSQWEREVSIKESQIKQPDDMIVEVSKTKVEDPSTAKTQKDPVTGVVTPIPGTAKKVDVPVYGPNPDIGPYQQQIEAVITAMKTLMAFTAELVKAIPSAISADNAEIKTRNSLDTQLASAIGAEKSKSVTKIDPKTKKRVVDDHKQRVRDHNVAKLEKERTANDEVRKGLRDDVKTLTGQQRDVGFDYREQQIARADREREQYEASEEGLTKSAAKANAAGVKDVTSRELDTDSESSGSGPSASDQVAEANMAAQLQRAQDLATSSAADAKASSDALRAFGSTGDIGQGGFTNAINAASFGGLATVLGGSSAATSIATSIGASSGSAVSSSSGAEGAVNAPSTGITGTAGSTQASGAVNLTINTLHPGDPQTLAAIANAATSGFAQQNPTPSSTITVGL